MHVALSLLGTHFSNDHTISRLVTADSSESRESGRALMIFRHPPNFSGMKRTRALLGHPSRIPLLQSSPDSLIGITFIDWLQTKGCVSSCERQGLDPNKASHFLPWTVNMSNKGTERQAAVRGPQSPHHESLTSPPLLSPSQPSPSPAPSPLINSVDPQVHTTGSVLLKLELVSAACS